MDAPSLSLLVLRTSQMQAALAFYQALGFSFVEEKHGSGPTHYSAQSGTTVVEIYPGEAGPVLTRKSSGSTMIGFAVASVESSVAAAQNLKCQIVTAPADSPWGRRAVVLDPDGRAFELSAKKLS